MSELLPKIARITRLLPQDDGRSDQIAVALGSKKVEPVATEPLSFPQYTKIPVSSERVNWRVQSGFPSDYFASHHVIFQTAGNNKDAPDVSVLSTKALAEKDQFDFAPSANSGDISQRALNILKAKHFFQEH